MLVPDISRVSKKLDTEQSSLKLPPSIYYGLLESKRLYIGHNYMYMYISGET